jgi:hypothetical protein
MINIRKPISMKDASHRTPTSWWLFPVFLTVMFLLFEHPGHGQGGGDYYAVTATAGFRPVNTPGTQRRVAQNDAEAKARRQMYEYVGSWKLANKRTVNDVLAKDARLKARILETIRNAELVDWAVNPQCNSVQVWMRIDQNTIRALLAAAGCSVLYQAR